MNKKTKETLMILTIGIGGVILFFAAILLVVTKIVDKSYDAIVKMDPAETELEKAVPHYCVIKGVFLMPVMLVSGENKKCQEEGEQTEGVGEENRKQI